MMEFARAAHSTMSFEEHIYHVVEFPCPRFGKMTSINQCPECHNHSRCDIYATMLDEDHDCNYGED